MARSSKYLEANAVLPFRFNIHQQIPAGILHHSQFPVRQEILNEALFFVRLEPGKVRLIFGIDTCHQFNVRPVFVRQVAVPCAAKVAVSPRPLFLARRNVVVRYMKHAGTSIILISTLKVKAGVDSHIGSRNLDILIVRDIYSGRIIHLVVSTRCDGETGYGTLSMVENGIDIGREYALIVVVHRYGRVCPPQEGLRYFSTIVKYSLDFKKSMSRTKRKTCHSFLMKHTFHFIHPYRDTSVSIFLNSRIYRHVGAGAVMLRPVKLNAT